MTVASELWEKLLPYLEWDGSWRDIYVLGVSEVEWNAVIGWLNGSDIDLKTSLKDGERHQIPAFEVIEAGFEDWVSTASFVVEGVTFNCHFFNRGEIEFDIDPRQVTQQTWPAILQFMTGLSRVSGKPCRMTPENCPDTPFLIVDAVTGPVFVPVP